MRWEKGHWSSVIRPWQNSFLPGTNDRGQMTLSPLASDEDQEFMSRESADITVDGRSTLVRRSDRFLKTLENAKRVTFVSHVHPDPDSLGSMLGLAYLVETCQGKPTRLTQDGLIC